MKKICYFCISLLLVPLLAVVALYFAYTPFEGVIHLSTIHGAATIVYESEYSIPYINGTTNEAVAYALGYAQAENRLYDLQLKRAVSSGRVAEVIFPF